MRPAALPLFGVLAITNLGCITAEGEAVRRASVEFSCPEDIIQVTPEPLLSSMTYDVAACGHYARYTCSRRRGQYICAREWYPEPRLSGVPQ